jgi:thiamine biosynthesis lipoprotein
MGTTVEISAVGVDAARFDAAIDDIEALLRDFERDYYAWGDGELAALNAALGSGRTFEVSPALATLLETARELSAASAGSFEPGIAPLVEAWGFHDASQTSHAPPSAATIAALHDSLIGIAALEIDGTKVASPAGPLKLDLGGIAKGYAVDTITGILAARGIDNALVNAGGDLRVLGEGPGRRWRIGVQSPRATATLATIELEAGEAAFTSGDYERFFDAGNERMHHLLDPATGYPATHTQAVTVLAGDGTRADAAATAIFVAGPDRWRRVARALGVAAVLRVDSEGQIEMTAAMRDRIQISAEYTSSIIPADP